MIDQSTRPYLLRAIYEWCADNGYTPFLAVAVDARTRVPPEHIKDGQIVLNIGANATRNLTMGNDMIQFSARFNGVSQEISVPVAAVLGIFARENGQGMFFPHEDAAPAGEVRDGEEVSGDPEDTPPPKGRPKLHIIK